MVHGRYHVSYSTSVVLVPHGPVCQVVHWVVNMKRMITFNITQLKQTQSNLTGKNTTHQPQITDSRYLGWLGNSIKLWRAICWVMFLHYFIYHCKITGEHAWLCEQYAINRIARNRYDWCVLYIIGCLRWNWNIVNVYQWSHCIYLRSSSCIEEVARNMTIIIGIIH